MSGGEGEDTASLGGVGECMPRSGLEEELDLVNSGI